MIAPEQRRDGDPPPPSGPTTWAGVDTVRLSVLTKSILPMMILDADLTFLEVNEAMATYLGVPRDELIGRDERDFIHDADQQMAEQYAEDPQTDAGTQEVRYVRPDGTVLEAVVDFASMPASDAPARWIGQVIDLTETRAREDRLRRLHRLSTVLAETNEAVFRARHPSEIFDASARIAVDHGGFLLAWVGLVDDEARTVTPVASAGDHTDYLPSGPLQLEGPSASPGPAAHAARTGESFFCNDVSADPALAPWWAEAERRGCRAAGACPLWVDGRVAGVLAVYAGELDLFHDEEVALVEHLAANVAYGWEALQREAAQRRTEEARAAEREQEDRLESLGQLAGGVAHDFNNLLSVILNYTTLLERQIADERCLDDLAQVREAAERAAALTRQLLTFARRDMTSLEPIDVNETVSGVASMLERTFGPHIEMELDLGAGPLCAIIDRPRLEQVVLNLAINARDALADGGRLRISTEAVTDDDAPDGAADVVIRVSDTGAGMSEEVAARAFEPFFSTKPRSEGTGLGLATVHGIVQRNGGDVSIESTPGEGTTVTVCLRGVAEAEPHDVTPPTTASVEGGAERILVVEDEAALRTATHRILADAGYQVTAAVDGLHALSQLEAGLTVDLVLTDVAMPRMRGDELLGHLRERWPEVRAVFISGYDSGEPPAGVPLVSKPAAAEELLSAVRTVLDQ